MNRLASHTLLAVVAMCGVLGSAGSAKAEFIVNGGFETGDFTGWTQSGNTGFTSVSTIAPHSGTYAAFFGPIGSLGFIEQTFAATAGESLLISFYFLNPGGAPNAIDFSFNGVTLDSGATLPTPDYVHYTYNVTAAASNTLKLGFRNDPEYLFLDDVSVTSNNPVPTNPVPAPAGAVLFAIGFVGMGAGRLVRRRKVAA